VLIKWSYISVLNVQFRRLVHQVANTQGSTMQMIARMWSSSDSHIGSHHSRPAVGEQRAEQEGERHLHLAKKDVKDSLDPCSAVTQNSHVELPWHLIEADLA
jgi:hypothetical protein